MVSTTFAFDYSRKLNENNGPWHGFTNVMGQTLPYTLFLPQVLSTSMKSFMNEAKSPKALKKITLLCCNEQILWKTEEKYEE